MKKVMLTCYDYSFARLLGKAACLDYVLVGDSLGMVVYGETGTSSTPLSWMCDHTRAVRRGLAASHETQLPLLVSDLPAQTYESPDQARETASALVEAGAEIVKLEGAKIAEISALAKKGFRVCAHLGLTPQTAESFRLQARSQAEADQLLKEALAVEEAGAELLVLEMIPADLAKQVTEKLSIPTIGIGAGPHCSGQVLVLYDLLGLNLEFSPKFLRRFANLESTVVASIQSYAEACRSSSFPSKEESYGASSL